MNSPPVVREPNFFIIGAPKCGTTALSQYLGDHPRVFMSDPKEPHFFSRDLPSRGSVRALEDYRALFRDAGEEHLAIGESSVWYLYSKVAVPDILDRYPGARLIVMIRDPVEMLYSLFCQLTYTSDEEAPDFETAWRLQEVRRQGKELPASGFESMLLQYGELGKHAKHIVRVLERAPADQLKVVVYDDFAANPRRVYEDVLAFLSIESDQREVFPRVNANKVHRLGLVGKFVMQPPVALLRLASTVKRFTGIERLNVLTTLLSLNTKVEPRPPLREGFRRELAGYFRSDVARLEELLGRELDGWLGI
jgi:hypothetical protein